MEPKSLFLLFSVLIILMTASMINYLFLVSYRKKAITLKKFKLLCFTSSLLVILVGSLSLIVINNFLVI